MTYFPLRWESTGDQWWYACPIDWAAANGHYDLVRELLRLDANHLIKLTSLRRIRRLEMVWDDDFHNVAACRSEVARKLLAECEIKKKNSLVGGGYGGWILYTAASAGDMGFVQELLQRDPLLVFGEGEYGVTDILYAAARSKNSEVFKVLLDFAASPRLGSGEIPAAYRVEIMNRAIHAAARGGNAGLLKELLGDDSLLAYRDVDGATVLHAAAGRGQVQVVEDLASSYSCSGLVEARDNEGNTALHVAAQRGHLAVVEALILASPSSITATNNAGDTFLHAVVAGFQTPGFRRLDRQIDLVKHLLSHNHKVEQIINTKNSQGRTALHLAVLANTHSDLVQLLMTVSSIDLNIRDVHGLTPLDILRQRPLSASSDLLTRRLISAGGIFTSQDYSARRVIASHIKRQSMGSSPGTCFRISDVEIFLYTGFENCSEGTRTVGFGSYSPEPGQEKEEEEEADKDVAASTPAVTAAQRLKRLLHWPKPKLRKEKEKKASGGGGGGVPVPLRERFSKPASSNKRALSVRSNQPSPTAKKKLASGVMHGVMQAIPHLPARSRSSSFSKLSFSSHSSLDTQRGTHEALEASCSSTMQSSRHDVVNRKVMMNQYLCFGGPSQSGAVEALQPAGDQLQQPYDLYERSVLSAA